MRLITQEEWAYFEAIASSYVNGVSPQAFSFTGAEAAKCHENAEALARQRADCPVVRGWLVAEIGNAPGFFRLVAHSVNRKPDGTLIDATPLPQADRMAYRFIAHIGTEDEFVSIRTKFPELYFPPLCANAC
jgi:hypothetical protein